MNRLCVFITLSSLCFTPMERCQAQAGGQWPWYRHDLQLTGRSTAVGDMTHPPVERWRYYLGGWKNEVAVSFAANSSGRLTSQKTSDRPGLAVQRLTWDAAPLVDLSGNGKFVAAPPGKIAKLRPDLPGLQQVIWEHPPGEPTRGIGRCFSFENGADNPRLAWQTEVEPEVYEMLWTIGDLDGDELPEVVFMTHYRILVYNGQTGEKKSTLKWPVGRNYGQMTLADVDGDALPEVVVVVDSPPHVDVLKYAPDEGKLLWSHRYITDAQVSLPIELKLRLVPNHVHDIDGDGRPEILYNLFNADGDFRWHVVVRDALSGEEEFNLPGQFLWGTVDLGLRTRTLCCLEATGRGPPLCGTARLIELRNGKPATLWLGERVCWQTKAYDWPLTEFTIASLGPVAQRVPRTFDVDGDGRDEVFVSRNGNLAEAIGVDASGKVAARWSIKGPPDSRLDVEVVSTNEHAVLLNVDHESTDLNLQNCRAELQNRKLRGSFDPLPTRPLALVADVDDDGTNEVVVQDSRWNTRVLRFSANRQKPREMLKLPGGGLWLGKRWDAFPYSKFPVFSADLTADVGRELLLTDVDDETVSTVACRNADGKLLWRRPLPDTPARSIVWMTVGQFHERTRTDLLVVVQSGSIGECFCLHGQTGTILWRMGELKLADGTPFNFGSHSPFLGVADLDGDGLSDLSGQSGQYIAVVRGKNGRPLVTPRNMIHDLFPRWVNYGVNVLGDWDSSGGVSMFTNTTTNGFGLIDSKLKVKWFTDRDGEPLVRVGSIGRAGKTTPWVFGTFAGSVFKTFDMTTGKQIVSERIEGIPDVTSEVICADIDGDGADEFLATANNVLVCIRLDAAPGPRLKWKMMLPTVPSELAVADADNDGFSEIVYSGTDGYLHCLGSKKR